MTRLQRYKKYEEIAKTDLNKAILEKSTDLLTEVITKTTSWVLSLNIISQEDLPKMCTRLLKYGDLFLLKKDKTLKLMGLNTLRIHTIPKDGKSKTIEYQWGNIDFACLKNKLQESMDCDFTNPLKTYRFLERDVVYVTTNKAYIADTDNMELFKEAATKFDNGLRNLYFIRT